MSGRAVRAQKAKQRERLKRSQKARRADGRHCADLFDEARFEWEQGQHAVARRLLDKILRLRPSHHAANEWLADLAFRDGAYVDCVTHFDRLRQPPAWPPVTYYAAIAAGTLDAPDRAVALLTAFLTDTAGSAAFEAQRDHARQLVRLWSTAARKAARAKRAAHTAPPASAAPVAPKATTGSTRRQASAGLLDFEARRPEPAKASAPPAKASPPPLIPPAPAAPAFPDITLPPPSVDFELVRDGFPDVIALDDLAPESDVQLRRAYVELRLQKGFDELISLAVVHDVTHFRYQLETVRRILRDFRGRVLLADEVGLGKTIEACLALKEYWMRGLVRKALILTPASLVSQWSGELTSRFGLTPATTDTAAFRRNPGEFWASEPLVVASLPLVRQATYRHALAAIDYDLVIVDEAHVLKNRASAAWQLVNSLKTRFLLLLSATPVGNNLSELYNLILLLRPGLLKTEATFRRDYGQLAALEDRDRRDRLRGLLREVMVRNTRAHIDLHLPRRLAATEVVTPDAAEAAVLDRLSAYVRERYATASATERWRLTMLQMQAGSSPSALRHGLREGDAGPRDDLAPVLNALDAVGTSAKTRTLRALVRRAPGDKKIVFTRFRATLEEVAQALRADGHQVAVFHGGLTAAAKEAAIAAFEADAEILLSSEIGGEGRNLQFCRTVVNFDLPWNPTTIEQRVGRVHRLGQTRDVFVFNLCLAGSIEEHILRILHDKINLFELVAGEMEMILGQIDPDQDFASLVMDVWAACGTPDEEARAFGELSTRLVQARSEYQKTRELDRALFSEDFEV